MKPAHAFLLALPLFVSSTSAAVLFSDSFDRANNRNIDGSIDGIVNNTGTTLAVDGVYTHPFIDPLNTAANNYQAQDANPANGGGAQISGNTLQLATGAGTSNAFINHNFTNSSITTNGNFTVTVAITGVAGTGTGQGGGFGIGMSLAEAGATGDAISGATKLQDAFVDGTFNGASNVSVADFWVVLRANSTLAWGGYGNAITNATSDVALFGTAAVAAKTGTISVDFTNVTSFNSGTVVNYAISYNGAPVTGATGTFSWSEDNANYIGLDGRDGTAVSFNDLSITTVPEPSAALLGLLGLGGLLRRRR